MKKNDLVSIVVPVYNAADYIERCITSIIYQTYSNIELLLINDGSTDNSLDIIKKYEREHDFIKVYDKENEGVSLTRNYGIKKASGKYIMFIDNDDYISSNYVEVYYEAIKSGNLDAVFGGYERRNSVDKVLKRVILKDTSWARYMIVAPWAKIYRLDFLKKKKIEFLKSNIGEDIYFNFQIVNYSRKIGIINDVGYKWFYNENSISNTLHKRVSDDLQFEFLLDSIYKKIKSFSDVDMDMIEYFFIKTICWFIFYVSAGSSKEELNCCVEYYFGWLKKHFPNYSRNKYLSIFKPRGESIKNRISVFLLVISYKFKFYKMLLWFFRGD